MQTQNVKASIIVQLVVKYEGACAGDNVLGAAEIDTAAAGSRAPFFAAHKKAAEVFPCTRTHRPHLTALCELAMI